MKLIFVLLCGAMAGCSHATKDASDYDKGYVAGLSDCSFQNNKWGYPGFTEFCKKNQKRAECAR